MVGKTAGFVDMISRIPSADGPQNLVRAVASAVMWSGGKVYIRIEDHQDWTYVMDEGPERNAAETIARIERWIGRHG